MMQNHKANHQKAYAYSMAYFMANSVYEIPLLVLYVKCYAILSGILYFVICKLFDIYLILYSFECDLNVKAGRLRFLVKLCDYIVAVKTVNNTFREHQGLDFPAQNLFLPSKMG